MKIEQTIRLRDDMMVRIMDAFSAVESFKLTSAQLNERVNAIRYERKVPAWVLAYLDGYVKGRTDELYRGKLTYGAWIDGQFYDCTDDKSPLSVESRGMTWEAYTKLLQASPSARVGHFWKDNVNREWFAHDGY